jgi:putative transposase
VDALGLVLNCHVSAANCADVKIAPKILFPVLDQYARIAKILADKSYRGDLGRDIEIVYGVVMEISERVSSGTFEVEPLRWIVERTWAWLDNARSLTRDYERLPENHAGMGLCCDDSVDAQAINQEPHSMERKEGLTIIYKHTLSKKSDYLSLIGGKRADRRLLLIERRSLSLCSLIPA